MHKLPTSISAPGGTLDLDASDDFVFIAEDTGPDAEFFQDVDLMPLTDVNSEAGSIHDGLDLPPQKGSTMELASGLEGLSKSYPAEPSGILPAIGVQKQRPSSASSADRSINRSKKASKVENRDTRGDGAGTGPASGGGLDRRQSAPPKEHYV